LFAKVLCSRGYKPAIHNFTTEHTTQWSAAPVAGLWEVFEESARTLGPHSSHAPGHCILTDQTSAQYQLRGISVP